MKLLLDIREVSARLNTNPILENINFTMEKGEHWAIVGESGSGKTSLANALVGRLFHSGKIVLAPNQSIQLVEQQHRFKSLSNTSDFYYQQRFQSQDAEDSLTVEQELANGLAEMPIETKKWLSVLQLDSKLDEPLIQLSNGENKRLQLVKVLLHQPTILVLDNPFIGLDTSGRALLHLILSDLVKSGIHIVIITGEHEIPNCITHILKLENGTQKYCGPKVNFQPNEIRKSHLISDQDLKKIKRLNNEDFDIAVKMVDVTIQYGDKKILNLINWEVRKGQRWSLSGPNGAGKSTLLSLITADNPQAYANEIYLFDKRRGKGESIWDIKKKLGFVSPEMHLYFPFVSTCFEVVASGLFDTVGLFRQVNDEQEDLVNHWLKIFNLVQVANKQIQLCPTGQQRMALLARALIKNPTLLVLDEPCQGLDETQVVQFNNLVDQICLHFDTTLIYVSHYQSQLPGCVDRYIELGGEFSLHS